MKFTLITMAFLCLFVSLNAQNLNDLQEIYNAKSKQLDGLSLQLEALTNETDSLSKEVGRLKR